MSNHLRNQTSPYLLQHADNPVNWYPWCEEAFAKAKQEDKPIFLSIGYSTCHWCHVMAHESFEDEEIAHLLNKNFVSIKVDKEERPDIDSIYMSVCQAFTGSGGWPTSIFMTADQKPFYAGTYFPKASGYGKIGFADLLHTISEKWTNERFHLLQSAEDITNHIKTNTREKGSIEEELPHTAVSILKQTYDSENGGFGSAPKFPTPHNLMFLMDYAVCYGDKEALMMAEHTLRQLYKGGIFDHIGYGFSRYSTDPYFLIPHFEKMLYDNALLIMSYASAFYWTQNSIYKQIATKIATYVLRELTSPEGGFYSAQDADSDGIEGKYYAFTYDELIQQLGEWVGEAFNSYYGITEQGNFEGKNIPNRLHHTALEDPFSSVLPQLYKYRKSRTRLHLDDKILTSWNSLMITAFSLLYRVTDNGTYLAAAENAYRFIETHLCETDTLYVSYRNGIRSGKGFLDDYAYYILALLNLYDATLKRSYLKRATTLCHKVVTDFLDSENGGFFMYGADNESLIVKPKDTYDGAIPSGNSVMAYNLVRLSQMTNNEEIERNAKEQLAFLSSYAKEYPAGNCFFLLALSAYQNPYDSIVCVRKMGDNEGMPKKCPSLRANLRVLDGPTSDYPLINDKITFYVCKNQSCFPPTNDLKELIIK